MIRLVRDTDVDLEIRLPDRTVHAVASAGSISCVW